MISDNGTTGERGILLVDSLPLRRAGLHRLLEKWSQPGCRVVEAMPDTGLATAVTGEDDPILVVLSIGGSAASSAEVGEVIGGFAGRWPRTPVVVISDRHDHTDVVAALHAGARGYITTDLDPDILFGSLGFIMNGGVFFPPDALLQAAAPAPGMPAAETAGAAGTGADESLTGRQADVLNLLREGHSNKHIAIKLGMRESTVKAHVRQLMRKLGASNRTQAALSSMQMGMPQKSAPIIAPHPIGPDAGTTSSEYGHAPKGTVAA